MAGLTAMVGRDLMESGKYSDLTVTCKGTTWKLHKAIALTLSGYLRGAKNFDGEAGDGLAIEHEIPELLQSVFEWLYTDWYIPPPNFKPRLRMKADGAKRMFPAQAMQAFR